MLLKKKVKDEDLKDSSGTIERKIKVHAQRKFAQGSPTFAFISKENVFANHHLPLTNGAAVTDMASDVMLEKCPKTEDFLSFLCFRGSDILPDSLKYFGDPALHNYPDGRPPSPDPPKAASNNNAPHSKGDSKSNVCKPLEVNNKNGSVASHQQSGKAAATAAKAQSQPKKSKKIPVIISKAKPKMGVSRIHSNFRKTAATPVRVLTRRDHVVPKPAVSSNLTPSKKKISTAQAKKSKSSKVLRKMATRLQSRHSQPASESSSSSESSEESSSEAESSSSSSEPSSPPALRSKRSIEPKPGKSASPKKITPASGKVTRQSAKSGPATRNSLVSKNSPAVRRQSAPAASNKSAIASPLTRDAARKLSASKLSSLAARRPSRRTKENATLYMTLMGQDEEDEESSDSDEQPSKTETKVTPANSSKKAAASTERKRRQSSPPPPPSPPGIRTRRSRGGASSVPSSPQAKKRAILREAARRFTAEQKSSSSSSSDEDSESASSSEEEEEAPVVRTLRTRSIDSTQASKNSPSVAAAIRPPEDSPSRQTRAAAVLKKNAAPVKEPPPPSKPKAKMPVPIKESQPPRKRSLPSRTVVTPPLSYDLSSLKEAPVFRPSEKEFADPIEYLNKIREESERFGICRIVPPASFKPECQLSDGMRFTAYNQYIHRMFRRRGANARLLDAILAASGIDSDSYSPPCIGGIEVDLPGLYQAVQDLGGPGEVLENNVWSAVADMLKIPRASPDRLSKLDTIYCKYLLPYATLSDEERKKLLQKVDARYQQRQARRTADCDEEDDDNECIVKGSSTALSTFYRVARNTLSIWFPSASSSGTEAASKVDPEQAEATYWKVATDRADHVCVNSANIDTDHYGYGFPCNKTSRHPWNLKVLTNNNGSILRSLGPVAGCTAPTLHVGMLFSTSCWYRDPHGLPWIDYLHTGADRIWYGAPTSQEPILKRAMTKLVPDLVKGDKSVWLSSDTVMVPPTMLADEGVSLSRTVQQSGQFIVIWPRAFTSSLCTGYTVSESVYFAPLSWLPIGDACFKELRVNCEPSVFSFQQLLWNIAKDSRSAADVLKWVFPLLQRDVEEELQLRSSLKDFGVHRFEKMSDSTEANGSENGNSSNKKRRRQSSSDVEGEMECEICRASLFFSRAEHHTARDADEPTIWCLSHALQKIKDRPRLTQNVRVKLVHDDDELRQSLQRFRDQGRNKPVRRNVAGSSTAHHQRSSTL